MTRSNPLLPELIAPAPATADGKDLMQRGLRAIRTHLGMDVAFIAQLKDGRRVFHHVDAGADAGINVGDSHPVEETFCQRIVDGRLPELMPNTAREPASADLGWTYSAGGYLGVPLRLSDGTLYGTFCCFRTEADESLNARDLAVMRAFADIAAEQIERDLEASRRRLELTARVQSVIDNDQLTLVYQPIIDLLRSVVIGYESLSRFSAEPARTPDLWFAEAAEVGLDTTLEMMAINKALHAVPAMPGDVYVSVNASPAHIESGEFARVVDGIPCDRVVLEITEHAVIADYTEVLRACRTLKDSGIRIAIDDAGSGYASFRHILSLEPDFIKLDMSLTRAIDSEPRRQALVAAFVTLRKRPEAS